MNTLQVRILAIGRIAQTIICQMDHLRQRIELPPGYRLFFGRVGPGRIFVEIVASMHDEIKLTILGCMGISVEIAKGQIGTADDADGEFRGWPLRQGPGAADDGFRSIGSNETIKIPAVRVEILHRDLGDMIAIGQCHHFTHQFGIGEIGACGYFCGKLAITAPDETRP